MAEGVSDVFGNIEIIRLQKLNCPLCLNGYLIPRSLTCLHTFCEGCIDAVIQEHADQWTERREIVCPVCSRVTRLTGRSSLKDWKRELPVNFALTAHPHFMDTENVSRATPSSPCDPCSADDEVNDAEAYCIQCNNYQCCHCVKAHSKFAVTASHTIIHLKNMTTESQKLPLWKIGCCDLHPDLEIEFFCNDHNVLSCYHCLFLHHRKCQAVDEVKDLGAQIRRSKVQHLLASMGTVQTDIGAITQHSEQGISNVGDRCDQIEIKLETIRKDAIQNINTVIDKARAQCAALRNASTSDMSGQIDRNKRIQAAVVTSNCLLKCVMDRGSDSQIFITYHKMKGQYKIYNEAVQREREGVACVEMSLEVGDVLTGILNTSVYDTRVNVRKTYPKPLSRYRTENVALVDILKREGIQKIPRIFGIDFLPSGLIVMVDGYNKQCCLLDTQYHTIAAVTLQDAPTDVTVVGEQEVAVAVRDKSLIQLISTQGNTLTPTRTIACSRMPYKLARVSDTEVAVGWYMAGVGIVSLQDGKEILYLDKDQHGREIWVEDHNYIAVNTSTSRFYHTSYNQNALFSFEYTGKPVYTFKSGSFGRPAGVAVDRDGNVCVSSWKDDEVYQVSPEGSLIRTVDVGVTNPYAICFDNNRGDMMAVVNNIAEHKQLRKLSVVKCVP